MCLGVHMFMFKLQKSTTYNTQNSNFVSCFSLQKYYSIAREVPKPYGMYTVTYSINQGVETINYTSSFLETWLIVFKPGACLVS